MTLYSLYTIAMEANIESEYYCLSSMSAGNRNSQKQFHPSWSQLDTSQCISVPKIVHIYILIESYCRALLYCSLVVTGKIRRFLSKITAAGH